MKKIFLTVALFCGLAGLHAQTGSIERVLKSIEQNNRELQTGEQNTRAEKLDVRNENNLEDPSVSYSRKFGEQDGVSPEIEFEVTQGIDFPTLYAQRRQYGKLQGRALDLQQAVLRRDILLRAKELCLDLIRLNQLKALYGQRLKNAEELNALFDERFEKGDVNILEVNKVKMELMNLRATVAENDAAYRTALQNLLAMNGNMPLEFDETVYPLVPELRSLEQVRDEVMGADYALKQAQAGSEAARKLVKVNRHGWLPKLEVGYGREGGSDAMLNGFVVGVSVPIFSNRGKVKAARARQAGAELAQEQVAQQVEADIQSLFNEATRLRASMQAYDTGLMDKTLSTLKQAVEAGQLSVLDYYSEAETVYASQEKLVDLENRYQKVVAQLYKNSL
ncbi:MAG TPA: transporter [Bacteroides sp.]|nr:TolC family protein [Phocaeicola coprophilus]HBB08324.1 transporter [Bacteroides sp.]